MRQITYHFRGRGVGTGCHEDPCHIIQCETGTVMAIIVTCKGIEFVRAHCRKAMIDKWGMYCDAPFRRASDTTFSRSWAEPMPKGMFLYRPSRLEIVPEQDWMRHAK